MIWTVLEFTESELSPVTESTLKKSHMPKYSRVKCEAILSSHDQTSNTQVKLKAWAKGWAVGDFHPARQKDPALF